MGPICIDCSYKCDRFLYVDTSIYYKKISKHVRDQVLYPGPSVYYLVSDISYDGKPIPQEFGPPRDYLFMSQSPSSIIQ